MDIEKLKEECALIEKRIQAGIDPQKIKERIGVVRARLGPPSTLLTFVGEFAHRPGSDPLAPAYRPRS